MLKTTRKALQEAQSKRDAHNTSPSQYRNRRSKDIRPHQKLERIKVRACRTRGIKSSNGSKFGLAEPAAN